MNKILISFLSLVMFVNPNTSHSSEIGINHEEIVNTENYKLPNQVGYIHVLEDLQVRIKNINDLSLDIPHIRKIIDVLKDELIRNDDFLFDGFEVNYIRNTVLPDLDQSLKQAIKGNKQERAQIVAELIEIYKAVANDLKHLGY